MGSNLYRQVCAYGENKSQQKLMYKSTQDDAQQARSSRLWKRLWPHLHGSTDLLYRRTGGSLDREPGYRHTRSSHRLTDNKDAATQSLSAAHLKLGGERERYSPSGACTNCSGDHAGKH